MLWNSSDERYEGENPECNTTLNIIENRFNEMSDKEIIEVIENLPELRREQLLSVFEELVNNRPLLEKYILR